MANYKLILDKQMPVVPKPSGLDGLEEFESNLKLVKTANLLEMVWLAITFLDLVVKITN